jgi:integrase
MAQSPKAKALAKLKAELRDDPLPLTPELEEIVVDTYLYDEAYDAYSGKSLADWVYKYLPRFFRWWAEEQGTGIVSLTDVANMRKYDAERFSKAMTTGPVSRTKINSIMSKFGGWLHEIERVTPYNPFKGVKMKKSRVVRKPTVHSCEELDSIFDAIHRIRGAPEGMTASEVRRQYNMFSRFLLQTGLRYSQAFEFTCGDFDCDHLEVDVLFGEKFCRLDSYAIIEAYKSGIDEEIKKKIPAEYVYVHFDLYSDIIEWCEKRHLEPDDRVMQMGMPALRDQARRIKERSGLPKFTWSLRHTWATVMYQMVGDAGMAALIKMGGWQSAAMPLQHYIELMSPEEAYKIVKKYHIYLPPSEHSRYLDIQQKSQELARPAKKEMLDEVAMLRQQVAKMQAAQERMLEEAKRKR